LILLNGVKISDVQTAHHSMNIPVPLEAVERIEILKGPAARIYGINALTGAINIVTTTNVENSITVYAQVGSAFKDKEESDGSGIYSGGSLQLVANIGNENFKNLLAVSQDMTNGQRYNTASENRRAFYQADLSIDEKNNLNWMLGTIQNSFGANGYYAAPNDKEAEELVNTTLVTIGSTHQIGETFSLRSRVGYRYNTDDYRFNRHDIDAARSEHATDVFSLELNAVKHTRIGDFGLGLESRAEYIESTSIGDRERYNHGMYAEYKTEVITDVLLNIGTYVNYNTQYGWQAFPGVDIAYLFHPDWKFTFNVGSSQRIPSFTDLYLQQAPHNIGNPDLRSENAWQYEGAFHYNWQNLNLQAGYFYRNIDGFIDWIREDSADPYQAHNFGQNRIHGLYFSVGQHWQFDGNKSLSYRASYNYLDPKDLVYEETVASKYVLESLKHQAILQLAYAQDRWRISTGNRFVQRELKNSYLITDLRLGYVFNAVQIYADMTNVLDQSYIETAAVPLPGRWVSFGVKYKI
jgi:iron complex outermembrane receptor protein